MISVGRELLRGRVADSNSRRIAAFLTQRGAVVRRIVLVGDDEPSISAAVQEALGRNPHLVVTSGGRVLCVVGLGDTVADAAQDAYAAVDKIDWEDVYIRRDIGHRAIAREQSKSC